MGFTLPSILTTLWFVGALFIAWPVLCIVQVPFYIAHRVFGHDPRRIWLGNIFRFFNALALWSNPFITVRTKNKHKVPSVSQKIIVVCNHQSNLDPFVLSASVLPLETKYVGKGSLFSLPLGGWAMTMAGDILIYFVSKTYDDMTTVQGSAKQCILKMKETLEMDGGLAIFPEGKRNADPEKGFTEFKIGAFKMAKETGANILPVVLDGSSKVWGVRDAILRPGKVAVVFGDIIKQEDYKDATSLLEATKKRMEELYVEASTLQKNM